MNPEPLPTSGAGEPPDTKNELVRVSFPAKMIARAREAGKPEHASVAQICRRALEKELDRIKRQQSRKKPSA
jgi:hypothetical protein